MITYLLLFMLMSPQSQPYCGKIVVQRYPVQDVLGKNGFVLQENEPQVLTQEKVKEIATNVVGKFAAKLDCVELKFEQCQKLNYNQSPPEQDKEWEARFSLWYKGIRINDTLRVVVTRHKVRAGYGSFYKVIHDEKCKSSKRISKSAAEKTFYGNISRSDKREILPIELVWHYNCYHPNKRNVLMPYWKDMQTEWEGATPDMISYCDGSVIPEFVN